jgi:hypothetical protein
MGTQVSLHGRKLAIDALRNNLISNDINVTQPCVDATITVGAVGTDDRTITIQLKDANGADINYVATVEIHMFLTADRLAYAVTGGSTGIAIGTDGALLALTAKKSFLATSEVDGDIDLTWTDTAGTPEVAFLGLRLPTGRYVMSSTLEVT